MDKKLHETTNLCVEIMNSTQQVKGNLVTWYKFAVAIRRKHDAKSLYCGSFLWNVKIHKKLILFWVHRFFSFGKILMIRIFDLILDFSKEMHP